MSKEENYRQAVDLLRSGNKEAARKILRAEIIQDPKDAVGWWLYAHAAEDQQQKIQCLQKVLELYPGHEKARLELVKLQQAPDTNPPERRIAPAVRPHPKPRPRKKISGQGLIIGGIATFLLVAAFAAAILVFSPNGFSSYSSKQPAMVVPTRTPFPKPTPTLSDCDCEQAKEYSERTAERLRLLDGDIEIAQDAIGYFYVDEAVFATLSGAAKNMYDYQQAEIPPKCLESFQREVVSLLASWWRSTQEVSSGSYDAAIVNAKIFSQKMGELTNEANEIKNKFNHCQPGEGGQLGGLNQRDRKINF